MVDGKTDERTCYALDSVPYTSKGQHNDAHNSVVLQRLRYLLITFAGEVGMIWVVFQNAPRTQTYPAEFVATSGRGATRHVVTPGILRDQVVTIGASLRVRRYICHGLAVLSPSITRGTCLTMVQNDVIDGTKGYKAQSIIAGLEWIRGSTRVCLRLATIGAKFEVWMG